MNKKSIEWIIKIFTGILTAILYVISIYEKSAIIAILTTFALLIGVIIVLWNKFNKEKNAKEISEREKKSLKKEIGRLRKETCKNCKRIYFSDFDESISFDENFDKQFFPYEGNSEDIIDIKVIYYLEEYFFIIFRDEKDIDGKCYLINLINSSIYLPVDNNEWKEVLGKGVSYRQLCSTRTNHFDDDSDQLL